MSTKIKTAVCALLLGALVAVGMTACDKTDTPANTDAPTVEETAPATEAPTESPTEQPTEAPTEAPIEEPTEAPTEAETGLKELIGLDVKAEDLGDIMQNVFMGTQSIKETVMILDKGSSKALLYPIDSIVSVTSYDGKTVYEEGKDYVIEDGKLKITADSSIPCITSAQYFNVGDQTLHTVNPATGFSVPTYWGDGRLKEWQVSVTYNHEAQWEGFMQESQLELYQGFVKKLIAGEDVTVFFSGDSITWGACSSYHEKAAPNQGGYAMLFTQALADLFGYTIMYVDIAPEIGYPCAPVPAGHYVAGDRGIITYVNTAIGGWDSAAGVQNFDTFIKAPAEKYGCDLLILAYGINDNPSQPVREFTANNVATMAKRMYELNPDAAVMIVSTMTTHMGSNWAFDHLVKGTQEQALIREAKALAKKGKACAVACVNAVSIDVQKYKTFNDYGGNNINHCNDWFHRVYAQTLLQTLIGYENMN